VGQPVDLFLLEPLNGFPELTKYRGLDIEGLK
jgi:hypothetical protein